MPITGIHTVWQCPINSKLYYKLTSMALQKIKIIWLNFELYRIIKAWGSYSPPKKTKTPANTRLHDISRHREPWYGMQPARVSGLKPYLSASFPLHSCFYTRFSFSPLHSGKFHSFHSKSRMLWILWSAVHLIHDWVLAILVAGLLKAAMKFAMKFCYDCAESRLSVL